MKKIYYAIVLLAAALCLSPVTARADDDPTDTGVALDKYVTGPDENGKYLITLEAYAKGSSVTTITETTVPTDIVLVLDVSGSMDYTITKYKYTQRASTAYTYNGYGSSSYYYKHSDGKYYKVSRGGTKNNRTLSYTVNSTTWYLSGSSSSTTAPTGKKNDDTIYTGVLYSRSEDGTPKKIALLRDAVNNFIDVVAANSAGADPTSTDDDVHHRISIVKFASSATNVSDFKDVTSAANVNSLKSSVSDLTANGGTRADLGMSNAKGYIDTSDEHYGDQEHKKVVILFTDGEPGMYGFDSDYVRRENGNNGWWVANQVASTSKAMKDSDVSVFTIGVLGNSPSDDATHYLDLVSSNYPGANQVFSGVPGGHTRITSFTKASDKFYQLSDGSDLSSIFEAIAEESSSGGSKRVLDSSTTTVLDVLTADFSLPEGTNFNDIGLFVDSVTGYENGKYTFGNRVNLVPMAGNRSDYVSFKDDSGTVTTDPKKAKRIVVTGFDFTMDDLKEGKNIIWTESGEVAEPGNWVGPRYLNGEPKYYGKRLVITIPIVPADDYQGGYGLPTNTEESGIYVAGEDEPVDVFPIPVLDFPSIGIIKKGLAKGESATFSILRIADKDGVAVSGSHPFTIILTGDGTANPAYSIIKDIPEGKYQVTEEAWSWTYDVSSIVVKNDKGETVTYDSTSVTTQILAENMTTDWPSGIRETAKCVIFTFTNAKKTGDDGTIYAESVAKNKFKGGSSTATGSTTINSKDQSAATTNP